MSPSLVSTCVYAAAYLLGGIPFGLLLGLTRGVDIRRIGSGNVGATNLARALGTRWGIAAFLLDFLKGLFPVLGAAWIAAEGSHELVPGGGWGPVLAGTAAILGHVFPVYLALRGGKGVATTFGVLAGLSWLSTLIMGAVWLAVFLPTRIVSLASLAAAMALPVAVALVEGTGRDTQAGPLLLFAVGMALLIVVRHRGNIRRLLRGEEKPSRASGRDGPPPHGTETLHPEEDA